MNQRDPEDTVDDSDEIENDLSDQPNHGPPDVDDLASEPMEDEPHAAAAEIHSGGEPQDAVQPRGVNVELQPVDAQNTEAHDVADQELQFDESTEVPYTSVARVPCSGPPTGMRRADSEGLQIIDALAGRASVFGFGYRPVTGAVVDSSTGYLGDGSAFDAQGSLAGSEAVSGDHSVDHHPLHDLATALRDILGDTSAVSTERIWLAPAPELAIETVIGLARRQQGEQKFRMITLAGSDHGRTGVCLTASGRPELQAGYGPMMSGFTHVPAGDLNALQNAVDPQTVGVLLAPVEFHRAGRPLDADYLHGVRELCDQQGLLLVIDETQLCFGATGHPFTFSSIADVRADAVVLSGGLFGGLPAGLVVGSDDLRPRTAGETEFRSNNSCCCPIAAAVATATLKAMADQGLPAAADESIRQFTVSLAEQIAGFEFIRDVQAVGLTIGIETDLASAEIVRAAAAIGLRLEAAGETAIRIQPPIQFTNQDQSDLLALLTETMRAVERLGIEMNV